MIRPCSKYHHTKLGFSMSLASNCNIPLESLLRAGMWTNPTTFLELYLKDASEMMAQSVRFRFGPIVTAQAVVGQ